MTRDESITKLITATGRPVGYEKIPGGFMCRMVYTDQKGGSLPEKYRGVYTGPRWVLEACEAFVIETWDVAAEHTKTKRVS